MEAGEARWMQLQSTCKLGCRAHLRIAGVCRCGPGHESRACSQRAFRTGHVKAPGQDPPSADARWLKLHRTVHAFIQ